MQRLPAAFLNPEELDRHWMEAGAPRPAKSKSAKQQLQKQTSLEGARSGASSTHGGLVDHTLDTLDDAAAAGHILVMPTMYSSSPLLNAM